MNYLLDTNVCIALINGSSSRIRQRYIQATEHILPQVSSIVAHELWYGVAKSDRVAQNANRLIAFLNNAVELLDYTEQDAHAAGEIRAELERTGQRIGEYDTLIAGQSFSRNLILVTANSREFNRIKGLIVEDWSLNLSILARLLTRLPLDARRPECSTDEGSRRSEPMRVPQLTLDDYEHNFADRHRLHDVVAKWALERPDEAALVSAESGRTVNWLAFERTTAAWARNSAHGLPQRRLSGHAAAHVHRPRVARIQLLSARRDRCAARSAPDAGRNSARARNSPAARLCRFGCERADRSAASVVRRAGAVRMDRALHRGGLGGTGARRAHSGMIAERRQPASGEMPEPSARTTARWSSSPPVHRFAQARAALASEHHGAEYVPLRGILWRRQRRAHAGQSARFARRRPDRGADDHALRRRHGDLLEIFDAAVHCAPLPNIGGDSRPDSGHVQSGMDAEGLRSPRSFQPEICRLRRQCRRAALSWRSWPPWRRSSAPAGPDRGLRLVYLRAGEHGGPGLSDQEAILKGLGVDMPIYPCTIRSQCARTAAPATNCPRARPAMSAFAGRRPFSATSTILKRRPRPSRATAILYTGDLGYKNAAACI